MSASFELSLRVRGQTGRAFVYRHDRYGEAPGHRKQPYSPPAEPPGCRTLVETRHARSVALIQPVHCRRVLCCGEARLVLRIRRVRVRREVMVERHVLLKDHDEVLDRRPSCSRPICLFVCCEAIPVLVVAASTAAAIATSAGRTQRMRRFMSPPQWGPGGFLCGSELHASRRRRSRLSCRCSYEMVLVLRIRGVHPAFVPTK